VWVGGDGREDPVPAQPHRLAVIRPAIGLCAGLRVMGCEQRRQHNRKGRAVRADADDLVNRGGSGGMRQLALRRLPSAPGKGGHATGQPGRARCFAKQKISARPD